jgi:hypothetical protein
MRWRATALARMNERLVQLGLSGCPVCRSGQLLARRRPVIQTIGGWAPDPEHNVLFLMQVTCDVCAYVMLFDSESLEPPGVKTLLEGVTLEEEQRLDEAQGES